MTTVAFTMMESLLPEVIFTSPTLFSRMIAEEESAFREVTSSLLILSEFNSSATFAAVF
ncbi:hypothetical protein D3C75_1108650 [compost metagenome]